MIAKVSSRPVSIMDEMLQCPYSLEYLSLHGRQSENPDTRGKHRDGCGIAFVDNGNIIIEKRTREDAWDESYIRIVENAKSNVFIAHNRKTSEGLETRIEGTHPFYFEKEGVKMAFSHNGTAETLVPEAKKLGTSDTKLYFEEIIRNAATTEPEDIMASLISFTAKTEYDSLSAFLITSRNELYAWRLFNEKDEKNFDAYSRYYTLYLCLRNNSAVIASEPLDDQPWMLLPNQSFVYLRPDKGFLKMRYTQLNL